MGLDSQRHELLRMLQDEPQQPSVKAEHLLRVVASVDRDAQDVWTELWGELKPHVTPSGTASPAMDEGFVPACGWPVFLERMWLLKHYLDSMSRICQRKQ